MANRITYGKVDLEQYLTESLKAIGTKLGITIPVRTEGWYALRKTVEDAQAQISAATGTVVRFDTSSPSAMAFSIADKVPALLGGTVTPTPTPTPAPSFTTQPSISPGSGTAGTTSFTGSDGAASNATSYTRRFLLDGAAIGTGTTIVPQASGSLVYEVTATGPGGSTVATSAAVTVAAAGGAVPVGALFVPASGYDATNAPYTDTVVTSISSPASAMGGRYLSHRVLSGSGAITVQDGASATTTSDVTLVASKTYNSGDTAAPNLALSNGLHVIHTTGNAVVEWSVQ